MILCFVLLWKCVWIVWLYKPMLCMVLNVCVDGSSFVWYVIWLLVFIWSCALYCSECICVCVSTGGITTTDIRCESFSAQICCGTSDDLGSYCLHLSHSISIALLFGNRPVCKLYLRTDLSTSGYLIYIHPCVYNWLHRLHSMSTMTLIHPDILTKIKIYMVWHEYTQISTLKFKIYMVWHEYT